MSTPPYKFNILVDVCSVVISKIWHLFKCGWTLMFVPLSLKIAREVTITTYATPQLINDIICFGSRHQTIRLFNSLFWVLYNDDHICTYQIAKWAYLRCYCEFYFSYLCCEDLSILIMPCWLFVLVYMLEKHLFLHKVHNLSLMYHLILLLILNIIFLMEMWCGDWKILWILM